MVLCGGWEIAPALAAVIVLRHPLFKNLDLRQIGVWWEDLDRRPVIAWLLIRLQNYMGTLAPAGALRLVMVLTAQIFVTLEVQTR